MPPQSPRIAKKKRKIDSINAIENKYLIFCEGEQTEPLYFKGFEESIKQNPFYKNLVYVNIIGVGMETLRVIYQAEEYVKRERIENAQIWCVYDRDSFPADSFNAVSQYAERLNSQNEYLSRSISFHTAWSNQCIEYWFLLHFAYYDSDNDRKYYRAFLHKQFAGFGFRRYEKNNNEIFKILTYKGNPKQAIKYAEKRLLFCQGKTESESTPATKVHLLVKELAAFLPEDIRQRYL